MKLVRMDELVGRRIAHLSNLSITGSMGILLKAKSLGYPVSILEAIKQDARTWYLVKPKRFSFCFRAEWQ
jgi:predicted nucleic acid-binding protein